MVYNVIGLGYGELKRVLRDVSRRRRRSHFADKGRIHSKLLEARALRENNILSPTSKRTCQKLLTNPQQPAESPQTNSFTTQTALIATVIAIIIAVFTLALKKGYVTIETVEESPEENPEDYSI